MAEYKTLKLTREIRKINHEITQWIKWSKYNLDIRFEYIGNLDIRFEYIDNLDIRFEYIDNLDIRFEYIGSKWLMKSIPNSCLET